MDSQHPDFVYNSWRHGCAQRGIACTLTIHQWWDLWRAHWSRRQRDELCMCRYFDAGIYELGNVYIAPRWLNNYQRTRFIVLRQDFLRHAPAAVRHADDVARHTIDQPDARPVGTALATLLGTRAHGAPGGFRHDRHIYSCLLMGRSNNVRHSRHAMPNRVGAIMSPRTWSLAGFLLAALIAFATGAGACAVPSGLDRTAALFTSCLRAQRPERRACEASYIAYAGTTNTRRH